MTHGVSEYLPTMPDTIEFTSDSLEQSEHYIDFNSPSSPATCIKHTGENSLQGKLASCINFWKYTLCAPEEILAIIRSGYVIPLKEEPPCKIMQNHSICNKHFEFVDNSIKELLANNCIKQAIDIPHVCNPLSVVCNREGKLRLVLDLRFVNRYLWKCKFKYEDLRTVMTMFEREDYVITFDLKSGYHHVGMSQHQWKYLGFRWRSQYYVFTVLPFGLSSACYIFTKLLRPLVRFWRASGIRAVLYIDDGIVAFSSLGQAIVGAEKIRQDLSRAGLTVNARKSCFEPAQACKWLGFHLDFSVGRIFVSQEKIEALLWSLQQLMKRSEGSPIPVREVAGLVGQIISMSRAVGPLARMFTRHLYAVVNSRQAWNSWVYLDQKACNELAFWRANIHMVNGQSMWFAASAVRVVYSDASGFAFGGYCVQHANKLVHGSWSPEECTKSSTWREIEAVRRVLEEIAPLLAGLCVKWCSDNQNLVRILQAGSKKEHLQDQAVAIFSICAQYSIRLELTWVPREQNVEADYISKVLEIDDWMLNPQVFEWLESMWGPHTVDRFANSANTQLPRFNSKFWSWGTEAVDAFTCSWGHENNWICPPPNIIPRVIRHMRNCCAAGTMVVPLWRSAPFWPIICPDGVSFAPFVVDWVVLPSVVDLCLPGVQRKSVFGTGPLPFPMLALRIMFV